jgi:hypothetical protein
MTSLRTAFQSQSAVTTTTNGAVAYRTSGSPLVDYFAGSGGLRGKDPIPLFKKAFEHDPRRALSLALYTRDVRQGQGERETFIHILRWLEANHPSACAAVIPHIAEMGRWDDLLVFQGVEMRVLAYSLIYAALREGNALCGKWMPRLDVVPAKHLAAFKAGRLEEGKNGLSRAQYQRIVVARQLAQFMELTPRQYRKLLVDVTGQTVETLMCAKQWGLIDFNKLPSQASARYMTAFHRNVGDKYAAYKAALVKQVETGVSQGVKINAGAVYPVDVLKAAQRGDSGIAKAQWEALPNWLNPDASILPMVDVSGSMTGYYVDKERKTSCMDVAISLGAYIATKQKGPMAGLFITFTDRPEIGDLTSLGKNPSLRDVEAAFKKRVGYSTDLGRAYDALLAMAKRVALPQAEMPAYILMLTDSQFDELCTWADTPAAIAKKFEKAGYVMPRIVFWNLNFAAGAIAARSKQDGVAMVCGYSPSTLKSILGAKRFDPEAVMLETADNPRYAVAYGSEDA